MSSRDTSDEETECPEVSALADALHAELALGAEAASQPTALNKVNPNPSVVHASRSWWWVMACGRVRFNA
jgi:hypothetical protein